MMHFFIFCLLLISACVQAHYIPSTDTPLSVHASLVATWRTDNVVDKYAFWQVPGTLMGGDSWPAEKGIQIDEMKLALGVRVDENMYSVLALGTHAGGSDDHGAVDLEHAYLGYVCCEQAGPWVIEAGRMPALFSPGLSEHESDRLSSESSLINDVFFGRNFHDEGARFMWHTASVIAGAEVWKGRAFPATASGGHAWDAFARYMWVKDKLSLTGGAWIYRSSAESRADHRYGGSHQHSPVAPPGANSATFPDTRFTGDTDLFGAHAEVSYNSENDIWKAGIKTEFMQLRMDGLLHDAVGRAAHLKAKQMGLWLQPYISWQAHTFGIRAEWLTTDNQITGAAANQLSVDSGMHNPGGFKPGRYSAIWHWQWQNNIALRTEVIDDKSLPEDNLRLALAVVWKQALWPFNGIQHH